MKPILVVGAGFSGAVHARVLAEAGFDVQVIDQRPHVGGNAYDHVDGNGVRVHAYGPHLFHTKNLRVAVWVQRFGAFVPYVHKVRARLAGGATAPLPINLDTVNIVFGTRFETAEEVNVHLTRVALPIAAPANAAAYLYAHIGRELTDLFFRPYTKKMWAMELEEMAAAVVKRIPIRTGRGDGYFHDDETQMMPLLGYAKLFESVFDHPRISVALGTVFAKEMLADFDFCFNSMPIDAYFDFCLGELPYRSLKFHHETREGVPKQGWSITNFTDDGPMTRETLWHVMPYHLERDLGRHTVTREEPCDYKDNGFERYYPVKTADGRFGRLYEAYCRLAAGEVGVCFIGRCGTYQYLDMDQVINQSLVSAERWLAEMTQS